LFKNEKGLKCLSLYRQFREGNYETNETLKTFKYLHDILEIEPFNRNLENELKNTPIDELFKSVEIENLEELKKELRNRNTFRCEVKDENYPTTRIGWIGLVMRFYKIFGHKVVETKKQIFCRDYKKFTIGYVTPYLETLDMILDYETEIRELKERIESENKQEYEGCAFE